MASRKVSNRGKYSRGKKYHRSRKTVRGHQRSTSGMIYPPLDIRSPNDLGGILKRITKGPITVVLIYADWCGHCHTLKPHFEKASNSPERNAQVISVRDDMLENYNRAINSKINSKAPQLNVEGYPSVLLVGPDGTKLSEIASTPQAVESAMVSAAPIAIEAGLSGSNSSMPNASMPNVPMPNASMNKASMNKVSMNKASMNNAVNRNVLLKKIGVENRGLANKFPSSKTSNQSFEHLTAIRNANRNANRNVVIDAVEVSNIGEPEEEDQEEVEVKSMGNDAGVATSLSIKPSSLRSMKLSTHNTPSTTKNIPASAITQREADSIVSLQGVLDNSPTPVSPPDTKSALRSIRDISGPNRIRGGAHGYGHGGSLYGMMSQTAYKLAPTAVLLATAASVMNKTHHKRRSSTRHSSTRHKKRHTRNTRNKKRNTK
jgi:thiol-disulfide isomerase/thioredoxin